MRAGALYFNSEPHYVLETSRTGLASQDGESNSIGPISGGAHSRKSPSPGTAESLALPNNMLDGIPNA